MMIVLKHLKDYVFLLYLKNLYYYYLLFIYLFLLFFDYPTILWALQPLALDSNLSLQIKFYISIPPSRFVKISLLWHHRICAKVLFFSYGETFFIICMTDKEIIFYITT